MKIYIYFLTIIVLLTGESLHSQSPDPLSFFPHHQGDLWEYFVLDGVGNDTIQDRIIFDSTDIQGTSHIRVDRRTLNPSGPAINTPWFDEYKIDTLGRVFASGYYWRNRLHYKLDAQIGEMWIASYYDVGYEIAKVRDIYRDTLFGISTTFKVIGYSSTQDTSDTTIWLAQYVEVLAEGFGIILRGSGHLGYYLYLRGAIINGQVYGDTTLVGIKDLPFTGTPEMMRLFQNYPNPFNPTTTITYELNEKTMVRLIVYNILGREVTKLAEGVQTAGRYTFTFDGNSLANGVYFITLEASGMRNTKRIILQR
jgi:hypothetical protein